MGFFLLRHRPLILKKNNNQWLIFFNKGSINGAGLLVTIAIGKGCLAISVNVSFTPGKS